MLNKNIALSLGIVSALLVFTGCEGDTKNIYTTVEDNTNNDALIYTKTFNIDRDGDGIKAYPWGTDYDDDNDGYITYLAGGKDMDDTNANTYKGLGDGTFEEIELYSLGEDDPDGSVVADMNNDGWLDYVNLNGHGQTEIWLNKGNKKIDTPFAPYVGKNFDNFKGDLPVADLDNDGNIDVVLAGSGENGEAIRIAFGNGLGGYSTRIDIPQSGTNSPDDAVVIDFDKDGDFDIAFAEDTNKTIVLLKNDGTANFTNELNLSVTANNLEYLSTADINNDGNMDLVVSREDNESRDGVSAYLGNGDGTFSSEISSMASIDNSRAFALGDMNGDGLIDVIGDANATINSKNVNGGLDNAVNVILGDGNGSFSTEIISPNSIQGSDIEYVDIGDINGDGHLDIVRGADERDMGAEIMINDGNGSFSAKAFSAYDNDPTSCKFLDLNGDGVLDIACKNGESDTNSGALMVMYGNAKEAE